MWQTTYEQYTKGWHEISIDISVSLHDVRQWCLDYESSRGFFIDYVDYVKTFHKPLRMKFESQEDSVMFMMLWLGI